MSLPERSSAALEMDLIERRNFVGLVNHRLGGEEDGAGVNLFTIKDILVGLGIPKPSKIMVALLFTSSPGVLDLWVEKANSARGNLHTDARYKLGMITGGDVSDMSASAYMVLDSSGARHFILQADEDYYDRHHSSGKLQDFAGRYNISTVLGDLDYGEVNIDGKNAQPTVLVKRDVFGEIAIAAAVNEHCLRFGMSEGERHEFTKIIARAEEYGVGVNWNDLAKRITGREPTH